MAATEAVVFKAGEYACKARNGTATVVIPRDITLAEISPAFAKLYEGRQGEST